MQWISEVLHFCPHLPIILVGCKSDLRYDQKTIEELHKTSQKPVTPEQVYISSLLFQRYLTEHVADLAILLGRGRTQEDRRRQISRMLGQDQ